MVGLFIDSDPKLAEVRTRYARREFGAILLLSFLDIVDRIEAVCAAPENLYRF